MAFLIGSASTTRFSSTDAINSGVPSGFMRLWFNGRNDDSNNSIATGTAENLSLYISSWGTQANIKACIYDENDSGALLETVVVNSSVGTGLVTVALAGTATITTGQLYRLGIYTEDADDITLFSDTGGTTLRQSDAAGSFTAPMDPSILGTFDSNNEFYWAIDDAVGGGSDGFLNRNLFWDNY